MEEILVSEMENNSLELYDEEGKVIELPIVGMFTVDQKYYVVVFIEPHDKAPEGELVVFRVEREDDREYVQMITDRAEWERALDAWQKIAAKAAKDGVVPVKGQGTAK